MNSLRHIALSALTVLCAASVFARAPKIRYDNAYSRNLWLQGTNITGMRADSVNASVAFLDASYQHNDYQRSWDPRDQWSAGAEASTIMHLKTFSLWGKFDFSQTMMYNACGSMFENPYSFPVDIAEFTPGTKSRQIYGIAGGVSADIGKSVRLGGDVSFKAHNCTKTKDLRYTDYTMDFVLRPSIQWHRGRGAIGASFLFERHTETITAEQIGEASVPYEAFLDKGLFYGVQTVWDGAALHISESGINGFPVRQMGYGAAIQASWEDVYAEFSYMRYDGKVGEKDAIWFTFPADRFAGTIGASFLSNDSANHTLKLDVAYQATDLRENIIDKTTTGGITTRTTYGSNLILKKNNFVITPSWKGFKTGVWEAAASASCALNEGLGTQMYPYYNNLSLLSANAHADGRAIIKRWSILAGGTLNKGWLSDNTAMEASTTTVLSAQTRYTDAFDSWKKYETAWRFNLNLGVRYDWKMGLFLMLEGGSEICLIDGNYYRPMARLRFGYEF